ncbi:hypothetical protein O9K51_00387 [Purpureocillium lavendulum]|uniref:Uncharacterized protein n=1 Tax=Purpureocillium lavendulum TaxID=1247861 RepID=A0AB34G486_9HYPO|nr:hypothetical protein O9K51_00387 [Purpureocillium lavendulum]
MESSDQATDETWSLANGGTSLTTAVDTSPCWLGNYSDGFDAMDCRAGELQGRPLGRVEA